MKQNELCVRVHTAGLCHEIGIQQTCATQQRKPTDQWMTDASKFRKMSYLVMLTKTEN